MAGTFVSDYGPKEFLLQVHARITERQSDDQDENMAGNNSARPPVEISHFNPRPPPHPTQPSDRPPAADETNAHRPHAVPKASPHHRRATSTRAVRLRKFPNPHPEPADL